MKSMVKIKPAYDFVMIFGQGSKNHDKIPTSNIRSREMHHILQAIYIILHSK
ncbi:MAG TPA: hypothetical protein PLZ32_08295 [Saprospiraceae bacterium]|nr:hypothetical protein [Saprospiraceae bacterium]